jgi:GGDEF domain-containing protein
MFHLQFEGHSLAPVTLSLGVAVFPESGFTSTGILRAVDAALYRAKQNGRGRVVAG